MKTFQPRFSLTHRNTPWSPNEEVRHLGARNIDCDDVVPLAEQAAVARTFCIVFSPNLALWSKSTDPLQKIQA